MNDQRDTTTSDLRLRHKGIEATFRYSMEDKLFHGRLVKAPKVQFKGATQKELEAEFHQIVDRYLAEIERRKAEREKNPSV